MDIASRVSRFGGTTTPVPGSKIERTLKSQRHRVTHDGRRIAPGGVPLTVRIKLAVLPSAAAMGDNESSWQIMRCRAGGNQSTMLV
jgi:hypothetical protein